VISEEPKFVKKRRAKALSEGVSTLENNIPAKMSDMSTFEKA